MKKHLISAVVFLFLFEKILNEPGLYFLSDFEVIKKKIIHFLIFFFIPFWVLFINKMLGTQKQYIIYFSLFIGFLLYHKIGAFFFKRLYIIEYIEFVIIYLVLSIIGVYLYFKRNRF